jgi:hypothetical protein
MSVIRRDHSGRSILGPVNPFDDKMDEVTETHSGVPEPGANTSGGLDTHLSRDRGEANAFRAAQKVATGEKPVAGSGFALTSNMDSGFSTMPGDGGPTDHDADTGSDTSGYGKGIAGSFPMSSAEHHSSDTGSNTSGYGKGLGGAVDNTLVRKDNDGGIGATVPIRRAGQGDGV